jgi:hypothetical protein
MMTIESICSDLPDLSSWTFVHQYPFSEACCTPSPPSAVPPLKPTVNIHSSVLERVALPVGRTVDEQRAAFTRNVVVEAQMLAYYPRKADAMIFYLESAVTPYTAAFAVELFRRHLELHVQYMATETFHRYVYLMRKLSAVALFDS